MRYSDSRVNLECLLEVDSRPASTANISTSRTTLSDLALDVHPRRSFGHPDGTRTRHNKNYTLRTHAAVAVCGPGRVAMAR